MRVLMISLFVLMSLFCNAQRPTIKTMQARLLSTSNFPPEQIESTYIIYKPNKFVMIDAFKFNFEDSYLIEYVGNTQEFRYSSKGLYEGFEVIVIIEEKTQELVSVTLSSNKGTLRYTSGEYKL